MRDPDLYDQLHKYLENHWRLEEIRKEKDALDEKAKALLSQQTELTWSLRPALDARPLVLTRSYRCFVVQVDRDSGGLEVVEALRDGDLLRMRADDRPIVAEAVSDHPVDDFSDPDAPALAELEDVA